MWRARSHGSNRFSMATTSVAVQLQSNNVVTAIAAAQWLVLCSSQAPCRTDVHIWMQCTFGSAGV